MKNAPVTDQELVDALAAGEAEIWPAMVVVCAGPPACALHGDEVVAAQMVGCAWCRRITVHADGHQTETGPGHA